MTKEKFKLSRYNLIFNSENSTYLWNTYSGAGIELDESSIFYISSFNGQSDCSDNFRILRKNGCIVPVEMDELEDIILDEKRRLLKPFDKSISFVIAPGLGCNYKCIYCFEGEQHPNVYMSDKTLEDVFCFITKILGQNEIIKNCIVTWFGGEPLLYITQIEKLSEMLINFCDNNKVQYNSKIVTNGRYLNDKALMTLNKCRVTAIQITLDGMNDLYCHSKRASSGDFDIVINNIKSASSCFDVNIRLNIDNQNNDQVHVLTEYLLVTHGMMGKIRIHHAFIRRYDNSIENEIERNGLYNNLKDSYIENFLGKYPAKSLGHKPPKRRMTYCNQICSSNLCIGPKGELYKCQSYFGNDSEIVGNIYDGLYHTANYSKYYSLDHKQKCKDCIVFPVCLGGCIDDRVRNNQIIHCNSQIDSFKKSKEIEFLSKSKGCL
jgi:uncharacterized protein